MQEALGINERLYGANHDTIAAALNTLVLHYIQQQRWPDALGPARRSAAISVQLSDRSKSLLPKEARRFSVSAAGAGGLRRRHRQFRAHERGLFAAQRALDTNAALALSRLAARQRQARCMAGLLRERQDLVQELEGRDKLSIAAVAKTPDQRDGQARIA